MEGNLATSSKKSFRSSAMNLMRKFSTRETSPPSRKTSQPAMKKSSSAMQMFRKVFSSMNLADQTEEQPREQLPDSALAMILDASDFFTMVKMMRINQFAKQYVTSKLRKFTRMEVWVVEHPELTAPGWCKHEEAHISVNFENDTVRVIMDDNWTGRDLYTLVGVMNVFHTWVESVEMDVVVGEIIVVSLGDLDIPTWFSFQSVILGFTNIDHTFHAQCVEKSKKPDIDKIYWPKVSELTVHADTEYSSHLSRILDYGFHSKYVLDRTIIDKVRIVLEDVPMNNVISRHVYHFRCWAGSAGFDHRYEVLYVHNGVVTETQRAQCIL